MTNLPKAMSTNSTNIPENIHDNVVALPAPRNLSKRLTFVKPSAVDNRPELGTITKELKAASLKTMQLHMAAPIMHMPKILPRIRKD